MACRRAGKGRPPSYFQPWRPSYNRVLFICERKKWKRQEQYV